MENTGKFNVYSLVANSYSVRTETLDGKPHIVVPVVMMKEGVHSGNQGAIYHSPEELANHVAAWDGIPIMIQHPKKNGVDVSANSPQVLETSVGRVFHTTYSDGLKAEAWIDVAKISTASTQALAAIRQGQPLEVSVGVFTDKDPTQGVWNGESYGSIARNYRPDHLALLPGTVGACSWTDGCGIRNNEKGEKMNEELLKSFKALNEKGYDVSLINNEEGYRETQNLIRTKLYAMDSSLLSFYLVEVFDTYFIYRVETRENGGSTLYKRNYAIVNNVVTFEDNAVEVRKNVEFVTLEEKKMTRTKKIETNNKGGNMDDVKLPCCEATVDALIANEATQFTAGHKEWLMTQERSVIELLAPKAPVQANKEEDAKEAITVFKETLKTYEDFVGLMPEALQTIANKGLELYTANRETLIKGIMDNSGEGVWDKEALTAMDSAMLAKIAKTADSNAVVDYSAQGAGGDFTDTEEIQGNEILYPTSGVVLEKETK